MTESSDEKFWRKVCRERADFIESHFGKLPDEILKVGNLSAVWPGGKLYKLEASKLGSHRWLYTTFGLTNSDVSATLTQTHVALDYKEQAITNNDTILSKKENFNTCSRRAGYGYEIIVITDASFDWPLRILQWAAQAEILSDANLLDRVEKHGGLTVEDIPVGDDQYANIVISKALSPVISDTMQLSNGEAKLLVATTITDDELIWAKKNSVEALLNQLANSSNGQISILERPSIFKSDPINLSAIASPEHAESLVEQGLLRKVHLFPLELGGQDVLMNQAYLPRKAVLRKKTIDNEVLELAKQGKINHYSVNPSYKETSVIPSTIEITVSGENSFTRTLDIWQV